MVPKSQTARSFVDEPSRSVGDNTAEALKIRRAAKELAANLTWLRGTPSLDAFSKRCQNLVAEFKSVLAEVEAAFAQAPDSEDLLWLRNNAQQLSSAARLVANELGPLSTLPVVSDKQEVLPRILAIAQSFLATAGEADTAHTKEEFTAFCKAFEESTPLEFHEIGALVPGLKLVLLERIAVRGRCVVDNPRSKSCERVVPLIRTLQHVTQTSWKDELESLIPFDRILSEDPASAYPAMDIESRNVYRERVAKIAQRSERTELQVAEAALALARQARARTFGDSRIGLRESHIGYYLVAEGTPLLCQRVGFHPDFAERLRTTLRSRPDEFFLFGVALLTLVIIAGTVWLLTPATTSPEFVLLSMLVLLLPGSQAAVQLMNYLTTNLLPVHGLPKLDFSNGIPDDCVTLVAIPTLLLNEKQVSGLIENLEVG